VGARLLQPLPNPNPDPDHNLNPNPTLTLTSTLTLTLTLTRWERGRYTLSTLGGHKGPVYGVRLRGDLLASSSEDGSIKLWNLSLGTVTP